MLLALPAFWVGLLYDSIAQDETMQLIRDWSVDQIITTYRKVPLEGLKTLIDGRTTQTIAKELLSISRRGLQRRAKLQDDQDESIYLAPLTEIVETGRTIATQMIEMFETSGSVETVIRHYIQTALI